MAIQRYYASMQKAALIFTVAAAIFFINDLFGFTFYYNSSQKSEQLIKLTSLIKIPPRIVPGGSKRSRSGSVYISGSLVPGLLERLNLYGNFPSSHERYQRKPTQSSSEAAISKYTIVYDLIWLFTMIGIYCLFLLKTFYSMIFKAKHAYQKDPLSTFLVFATPFIFTANVLYVVLSHIPIIYGEVKWNLLINGAAQTGTFVILMQLVKLPSKMKKRVRSNR